MKKLKTILKSRYFTAFLFLTAFGLLFLMSIVQSSKITAYQEKYKKDLEIQLQLVEKVNQLNNELMEEEYIVSELREELTQVKMESEDERNDLLSCTANYYKYKKLDQALKATASKNWDNGKPSSCTAASADLYARLKNSGILSVRVDGKQLNSGVAHEVIFVGFEPQNAQLLKTGAFKPLTLQQNWYANKCFTEIISGAFVK